MKPKGTQYRIWKFILVGFGTAILALIFLGFLVLSEKLAFDRVIGETSADMAKLGGGVSNGRRNAEGWIHLWAHDGGFDAAKLAKAMQIAHRLDQHGWVERIYFDLQRSGIRDSDISLLQGLRKLKSVDVSETTVTQVGLAELEKLYPNIEIKTNSLVMGRDAAK